MEFWRLDINGELWRPTKNGVASYGKNTADIIGTVAYGGWNKIHHAIMPWRQTDNI